MPALQNLKHERFAQLLAKGKSAMEAYEKAIAQPGNSMNNLRSNGATYLRENSQIVARKEELQRKNARIAERRDNFTKEKLIDLLIQAITQKPSQVSAESKVCEVRMSKMGPYYATIDKKDCMKQLAQLCGWNAPLKVDLDVEASLTSWVQKIRQAGQARVIDLPPDNTMPALGDGDDVDFSCD